MKGSIITALLSAVFLILILGCHAHSHHGHSHSPVEPEPETLSYTFWSKAIELFVEFSPLIAGQEASFAAHFTDMTNFRAIEIGEAMVFLLKNKKEVAKNVVDTPTSPGIFNLGLTPNEAGVFDLNFIILSNGLKDTFLIENVSVYANKDAALEAHPPQPESDDVSFLKEQAWKVDFAIEQANRGTIHQVIRTSGEILPLKGEEKMLAAKSSGLVFFKSKKLQEGREVRKGEVLFSVSSKGLIESNLEEKTKVAMARLEKTKANFERAKKLLSQQIIGQKEYEQRKMEFSIADAEYQTLTESFSQLGKTLSAPMSGIVKNVLVTDGQFVSEGTPLVEITSNRRLMIHADVSQQYLPVMTQIRSANFKTPYLKEVQSIEDYHGQLVSYGKMVEEKGGFIPVLFELDNIGQLIPGSFVELFLLTKPIEDVLLVPKAALMEDYGSHYVFIQKGGESFEKREIQVGIEDGKSVQVLSGITEGEWIVTRGAYQVKMASMSSSVPAHGHAH